MGKSPGGTFVPMSELVDFRYAKLEREVNLNVCKILSSINILELFLTSLGMSEVDTVRAWGGQTSTPLISKYFSEMFSPSHITLTNNNLNKDFKSVKRPYEVEKLKLVRKIFSG